MSAITSASNQIRDVVDNYRYSVVSYQRFLEVVYPMLGEMPEGDKEHLQNRIAVVMKRYLSSATPDEIQEFREVSEWFNDSVSQRIEALAGNAQAELPLPDPARRGGADRAEALSREVSPRVGSALMDIFKEFKSYIPHVRHTEILFRGVLSGLVGQFEVLVSDLAHHFYKRAPGSLGGTDKVLSVSELLSFASIEEATEFVIADKVDDLLRGSADDWKKFFDTRLKVSLEAAAPEWPRFVEYIQRRHLIVHAGGKISRRYLRNVDSQLLTEYFGEPQVGQEVRLDYDYISRCLEEFEITGLRLGLDCWRKLHSDHAKAQADYLDDVAYDNMLRDRWGVCVALTEWGAAQSTFDASSRTTFMINMWLAQKRLGRWAECDEQVRQFDCSALKPVFQLARAALLDDVEQVCRVLEEHEGAFMDERAWDEWPLLMEARSDPRFQELRERYSKSDVGNGDKHKKPNPEADGGVIESQTVSGGGAGEKVEQAPSEDQGN